ncbi:MAG: pyruvate, phosphate dikinase [Deltaproteobacteria bacterium]|nr:pyruvate, phosphate dikinase [Deltaproteobacteria bacterium]
MTKTVFSFRDEVSEADLRPLLGGKGAGLNLMTHLGIPVPPGFTLSTQVCNHFREHDGAYPDGTKQQVLEALAEVEANLQRGLGDAEAPLLVSVRSGARASMPGMMDTILNLGLNDQTVEGLARLSGDRRFAFDAYRRFLQMYGDVVLGVPHAQFEQALSALKVEQGDASMLDQALPAEALERLVVTYQRLIEDATGGPCPSDTKEQLWGAIGAVFGSWDNARAIRYRRMQEIDDAWGTACTIQAMVFGNQGDTSGSGVAFTRNPSTGERALYGEYLPNAQGEDVVAGIRTPLALTAAAAAPGREDSSLERAMPAVFQEFVALAERLEAHFRDMQDIEFTIQDGEVFILQTRTGKRTAHSAVKVAVSLVDEGVIEPAEAVLRVDPTSLEQLLHARLPAPAELESQGIRPLAIGLPASPGAASGRIVFHADDAERLADAGKKVILVRRETSPEDIHGMQAAEGILTATGGMTSHAAVVARGLGKCCVAGVSALSVDYAKALVTVRLADGGTEVLKEGDAMTLDGSHGAVYAGTLEVSAAATLPELERLMEWADARRVLGIRANADTPEGARQARSLGAQGIGLCRTEHMFFAEDRLEAVRCMVLARGGEERETWLKKIEPMQEQDFLEIFEAMQGLPVTVRLLDWPLHEFIPKLQEEYESVARALGDDPTSVRQRAEAMHELNPMLGHRGARVGLTVPGIYRTQARAVFSAACKLAARGIEVHPEIMIPVVGIAGEVERLRAVVEDAAREVFEQQGREVEFLVGTMIELPRACLRAGEIAAHADFFSFGTNDLTQTTFGISRDDAGKFLPAYVTELGLLEADPFVRLDLDGVGALVAMAVERGRAARPGLKLGLCGEHGGEPRSIGFCAELGLDYVSCSPPRLPVARLAAAQAAIRAATA